VQTDGKGVVAYDGSTRWRPESGQLLFDFTRPRETRKRGESVVRLRDSKSARLPQLTSEQWCDLAMEIEEGSPLEARAAYHHALDLDPGNVVARINLGRLLHGDGNLVGAEAHFRDAVRYDPTCALGWYNLGVVLEDAHRADEALGCYEQAVAADAKLADAHWNLSLLYERGGRHQDAIRHLAIYRRLTRDERT
jgi:tetratricopeptide (TPR) repeat protein